jgi:GH15 family glucan-1,4-alpha-glucosidase
LPDGSSGVGGRLACVRERLGANGLLFRNHDRDRFRGPEGAFGICSFWLVEALAEAGQLDEARETFERLLACANDVGLLGEEIDPETGAALGNFPQAFTHVGLINAALTLHRCETGRAPHAGVAATARGAA